MATLPPHLLDVTSGEAKRFSEGLFRLIDARRDLPMVTPETTAVWNGTPLAGHDPLVQFLMAMPPTQHEITGYNVLPLPNGNESALNMMVDTSGRVQFGTERGQNVFAFSSQFIVRRLGEGAPCLLQTMVYRLVHKPHDATILT